MIVGDKGYLAYLDRHVIAVRYVGPGPDNRDNDYGKRGEKHYFEALTSCDCGWQKVAGGDILEEDGDVKLYVKREGAIQFVINDLDHWIGRENSKHKEMIRERDELKALLLL